MNAVITALYSVMNVIWKDYEWINENDSTTGEDDGPEWLRVGEFHDRSELMMYIDNILVASFRSRFFRYSLIAIFFLPMILRIYFIAIRADPRRRRRAI